LKEIIITKSKTDKDLFLCAKASRWGDLFPITNLRLKTAEEINAVKEEKPAELPGIETNQETDTLK